MMVLPVPPMGAPIELVLVTGKRIRGTFAGVRAADWQLRVGATRRPASILRSHVSGWNPAAR